MTYKVHPYSFHRNSTSITVTMNLKDVVCMLLFNYYYYFHLHNCVLFAQLSPLELGSSFHEMIFIIIAS